METDTANTLFGLPMPIVGLIIAVFVLIYLVLRTRVHAFIAMLIASAIAGTRLPQALATRWAALGSSLAWAS